MSDVEDRVDRLEDKVDIHQDKLHLMEIKLTKIEGTVDHIKDRLDNGISKSLSEVVKVLPLIKDNTAWITRIKNGIFFIFIAFICGGLIKFALSWANN